jgi:hypothetical protein
MAIFIGAVLTLLSIAVIVYPFLKSRASGGETVPEAGTDSDVPDLDAIYEAIRTLQLEHQLGNIPQGLYQEQLDSYRIQAALALKHHMEAQRQDEDWPLEQEIMLARSSLAQVNGHAMPCSNCGARVSVALTQCPECSTELGPPDRVPQVGPET